MCDPCCLWTCHGTQLPFHPGGSRRSLCSPQTEGLSGRGGFSHSLCGLGAHQPSLGLELRTESRGAPDRPLLLEGLQVGQVGGPSLPCLPRSGRGEILMLSVLLGSRRLARPPFPGSTAHTCVCPPGARPTRGLGRHTGRHVSVGWPGARCLCPGPVGIVP